MYINNWLKSLNWKQLCFFSFFLMNNKRQSKAVSSYTLKIRLRRGWVLTLYDIRGCAAILGLFCLKKSLNMGTIFMWKMQTPEKMLKMGTFFGKKYPWTWELTWVWVPSCRRHIPDQSKSETPPPDPFPWSIIFVPLSWYYTLWECVCVRALRHFTSRGALSAQWSGYVARYKTTLSLLMN